MRRLCGAEAGGRGDQGSAGVHVRPPGVRGAGVGKVIAATRTSRQWSEPNRGLDQFEPDVRSTRVAFASATRRNVGRLVCPGERGRAGSRCAHRCCAHRATCLVGTGASQSDGAEVTATVCRTRSSGTASRRSRPEAEPQSAGPTAHPASWSVGLSRECGSDGRDAGGRLPHVPWSMSIPCAWSYMSTSVALGCSGPTGGVLWNLRPIAGRD